MNYETPSHSSTSSAGAQSSFSGGNKAEVAIKFSELPAPSKFDIGIVDKISIFEGTDGIQLLVTFVVANKYIYRKSVSQHSILYRNLVARLKELGAAENGYSAIIGQKAEIEFGVYEGRTYIKNFQI